jgi:hypothetical protein
LYLLLSRLRARVDLDALIRPDDLAQMLQARG